MNVAIITGTESASAAVRIDHECVRLMFSLLLLFRCAGVDTTIALCD